MAAFVPAGIKLRLMAIKEHVQKGDYGLIDKQCDQIEDQITSVGKDSTCLAVITAADQFEEQMEQDRAEIEEAWAPFTGTKNDDDPMPHSIEPSTKWECPDDCRCNSEDPTDFTSYWNAKRSIAGKEFETQESLAWEFWATMISHYPRYKTPGPLLRALNVYPEAYIRDLYTETVQNAKLATQLKIGDEVENNISDDDPELWEMTNNIIPEEDGDKRGLSRVMTYLTAACLLAGRGKEDAEEQVQYAYKRQLLFWDQDLFRYSAFKRSLAEIIRTAAELDNWFSLEQVTKEVIGVSGLDFDQRKGQDWDLKVEVLIPLTTIIYGIQRTDFAEPVRGKDVGQALTLLLKIRGRAAIQDSDVVDAVRKSDTRNDVNDAQREALDNHSHGWVLSRVKSLKYENFRFGMATIPALSLKRPTPGNDNQPSKKPRVSDT